MDKLASSLSKFVFLTPRLQSSPVSLNVPLLLPSVMCGIPQLPGIYGRDYIRVTVVPEQGKMTIPTALYWLRLPLSVQCCGPFLDQTKWAQPL